MVLLGVMVEETLKQSLSEIAEKQDRDLSWLVRKILSEYAQWAIKSPTAIDSELIEMAQDGLREHGFSKEEIDSVRVVIPAAPIPKKLVPPKKQPKKNAKSVLIEVSESTHLPTPTHISIPVGKIDGKEAVTITTKHPLWKKSDPPENTNAFLFKYDCNNYEELEKLKK